MADSLKVIISCELKDLSSRVEALTEEFQIQRGKDIGTFYLMPEQEVIERVAGKPQIILLFEQPAKELNEKFPRPVEGRISFRLMQKDALTITHQDLELYANRIKTLFGGETPFVWYRGKELHTYKEEAKGYRLQILAQNEQSAKRVVEQVLDIQSHSPDWEFMDQHTPAVGGENKYDDTPTTQTILNKPYRKKRRRPTVTALIKKAEIYIDGIAGNILLYDHRTGYVYKPDTQ